MRRYVLLSIDLLLVALAATLALALRDNLEIEPQRLRELAPFIAVSLGAAAVILPLLGLHRAIWRMSVLGDYMRVVGACVLIVIASMLVGFLYNRLDGVARTFPVLYAMCMVTLLVGARVLMRVRHVARAQAPAAIGQLVADAHDTVLIIGINNVTDLYLASIRELDARHVRVAGLLGRSERHSGRLVQSHKVLGTPEQVETVLRALSVHGVLVSRIVVTVNFDQLSGAAQEALLGIEKSSTIKVDFLAEKLGLAAPAGVAAENATPTSVFNFTESEVTDICAKPYWRGKRVVDIVLAAMLIVLLCPLLLAVAGLAVLDVGMPILFWQQRPGRWGQPFKLYKFRTMAGAHDRHGRRIADEKRLSPIGWFLRRTRLDELPQLFNILIGEMSFVGPRPLLPIDQPPQYAARLLAKPGLTGWAQIMGGREISAEDKAALDVWYVQNASLALDLSIMASTVPMIIRGERANPDAITKAWEALRNAGICSPHSISAEADGGTGRAVLGRVA